MRKNLLSVMVILYLSFLSLQAQDFSITIDAEKDAWYGQLTGFGDGRVYLPAACHVTDISDPAPAPPDNDADLSALVWMAHDSLYVYLYTEVKDDIVIGSNPARYLNDCIELKFDPEPSEGGTYSGLCNTRLTALGDAGVGGIDNLSGLPGYIPVEGEDYARKITDDGYALEFRMPIENIEAPDGRSLYFNETGKMGLAINIGDNDSGTRDNMLQWSAGHTDAAHGEPKYLGTVTFLDDHKLGFEAVSIIDPTIVNENAVEWYTNIETPNLNNPKFFKLAQNYPNPFNPSTSIQYEIFKNGEISLTVYDINGNVIKNLISNKNQTTGTYTVDWNGTNNKDHQVTSGVYFYELTQGSQKLVKKMMLIR